MRKTFLALTLALAATGCATQKVERAQIKFLHWNVNHFGDGSSLVATIDQANGPEMAARYTKFIGEVDADVIGICRYDANFTTNGSMKADKAVFKGYNKAVGPSKGGLCNAVFHRTPPMRALEEKTVFFGPHYEDTYYKAVKLNVGGVGVWFVQTQLDCHTYLRGHAKDRESQMRQIIADFKDEPYVVIAGDFRVGIRIPGARCFPAPEEYDVFKDAGYELANLHGTGTYPVAMPLQPVDNVIAKGVEISEVRFLEADRLSNHLALSCKLTVYEK